MTDAFMLSYPKHHTKGVVMLESNISEFVADRSCGLSINRHFTRCPYNPREMVSIGVSEIP
jgi:hypothetical protein